MKDRGFGLDYYDPMISKQRFAALLLFAFLAAQAQPRQPEESAPTSSMDSALFYQLLLGELNLQGNDPGAAFSLLLDAARKTSDTRLFKRAIEIALQSRAGESALQAARAWRQAEPNSREANRYILQIVIALNRLPEVVDPIKREIKLTPADEREDVINSLPRYFARASNKKQAASLLEQALADQLQAGSAAVAAAAWTSVGRLRLDAKDSKGALEAARKGHLAQPRAEGPVLLALLLIDPARPQAEALARKYLESGQVRPELRLEYARRLLEGQRTKEAFEQTRMINDQDPGFAEAWLIRGILELENNALEPAEQSLKRYVDLMSPSPSSRDGEQNRGLVQAYLSLSLIAEKRSDMRAANEWLSRITNPQDAVRVQSRRANLLASQGRLEEGRKLLQALPERTPEQARAKINAEIQLLREYKQYQPAYDMLVQATRNLPDDHELLYDLATLAEKLGRPEEMERILRNVMALKPDYAHSYNALGYSLADRALRLDEARELIAKAMALMPGDPYIADSLGWLEFRSGNKAQARRILEEAFKKRPDAEIAAHLGEVLWSMGEREKALAIWREGSALNAANETLLETLKRLDIKL